MADIYWTSDTHFGHRNIIKYSKRPFATADEIARDEIHPEAVEKMDAHMIAQWNGVVQPEDTIYHLGDFSFHRDHEKSQRILDRLNGHKHLCPGNHDSDMATRLRGWESVAHYRELRVEGRNIVMLHYGMRVWNRSHKGALQFYGHSHGTLPGNSQSLDVGTDCWNYTPVGLGAILARLATLPPYRLPDHHGTGAGR